MEDLLFFLVNHFNITSDYIKVKINNVDTFIWDEKRLSINISNNLLNFNYNIENGRNIYFSLFNLNIKAIENLKLPIKKEEINRYFSNNIKLYNLYNFNNLNYREKKVLLIKLNSLGFSKSVKTFYKGDILTIRDGNRIINLKMEGNSILISKDIFNWSRFNKKDLDIINFDFKIKGLLKKQLNVGKSYTINMDSINSLYYSLMNMYSLDSVENYNIAYYLLTNRILKIEEDLFINSSSINKQVEIVWSNSKKILIIKRELNRYIYSFKDYNLVNFNLLDINNINNLIPIIIRNLMRRINSSLSNRIIDIIFDIFNIDINNCNIELNNLFNISEGLKILWNISEINYELNIRSHYFEQNIIILIYLKNGIVYNEKILNLNNDINNIISNITNLKENQVDSINDNYLLKSKVIKQINIIISSLNTSNLDVLEGEDIYNILNIKSQFFYILNGTNNSQEIRWLDEYNNDLICKIERTNNNIIRIFFKGKYYRLTEGPNRLSFDSLYNDNNNIKNIIDSIENLKYWNLISDEEKRELINSFINTFNINLNNINIIDNNIYWKDDNEFNHFINLLKSSNNFLKVIHNYESLSKNFRKVYILDISNKDEINNLFYKYILKESNINLNYNKEITFSKKGLMPINYIPEDEE